MPPTEEEEDASCAPKKATTLIFKEVLSVILSKCKFQMDNLDIYQKTFSNSWVSPDSTEVAEISIPSTIAGPTTRPGTPMLAATTHLFGPTFKCLTQL